MQFKPLSVLCLALVGGSVFAQTKAPEPDYTFAYNIGVNTDYRFRGISQTRLDPSVFGGIDFTHKSGFYLGTWASSIKWIKDAGGNADAEIDIYGGYRGSLSDVAYDIGVLRYLYPSANLPRPGPYTTEVYGAVTVGPVTAKYSHGITDIFGFVNSKNSGYLELAAAFDLGSGWSLVPHIGHQRVAGTGNGFFSYTDYSLAVNYDFGNGVVASATAIGADTKKNSYVTPAGKDTGRDSLVLGVKYRF